MDLDYPFGIADNVTDVEGKAIKGRADNEAREALNATSMLGDIFEQSPSIRRLELW